jgi:hypothetical protein
MEQLSFAPREDVWRLASDLTEVRTIQESHADRLARLERRQEEDARMKSVWGTSSPFPGVLSGTPQLGKDEVRRFTFQLMKNQSHP